MACVKACPGNAFSTEKTVKVNLAGHDVEWSDIDISRCTDCFRGIERTDAPQADPYLRMAGYENTVPGNWSPFYHRPDPVYKSGQAICGSRGCTRACMISLENRGVLENSFKQKFRRRPTWQVDWGRENETAPGSTDSKDNNDVD